MVDNMPTKKEKKKKSDPTEYEWILLLLLIGLLALTFILFVGVTFNNFNNAEDRLDKIENSDMFIRTSEYEEVCNDWETNEVNEIIYLDDKNKCKRECSIGNAYEVILNDNGSFNILSRDIESQKTLMTYWDHYYALAATCANCLNQTDPFIQTDEFESCTEWILVKR